MGGDAAPSVIVDGAVAAARALALRLPFSASREARGDTRIALVGAAAAVAQALMPHPDYAALGIDIVEAPDVIGMADSPAAALRRKPRASIRVAAELVAGQDRAALFSAGHTGATVMAAHAAFGMIPGVDRPALATTIPTRTTPAVLLDAGANVECRPQHLVQFAIMGSVYARLAFDIERPRVGLLSIGEEETKGNELTREAHQLLKASPLNFIGNVEGREIYSGGADVIVCDGFTGNVVLKTSEGLVDAVEALLGDELQGTFSSQVGYLLSRRAYRRFRKRVDYSEYGGAPLLGVAGLAVVGHGRSSVKAVRNAVLMAYRFATSDFNAELRRTMDEFGQSALSRPS
jgi:glycerol-3-phosphate acyltransferase PlsX